MPILSSRAAVLVWSLRPGWEVPGYQMSPPTVSEQLLSPEGENKHHMMFQSSCDKAWVPWKANLLLAHLIPSWFHVPELSCAACFPFLCKAPLIWAPAGSHVPVHILPLCCGGHMGSVQPVLGALSLPEGPASVHSMLCKPRAAGCVSSMFRVSQMKGLKGEKDYRFSIPVIYSLCGLTSNLAFLPSQHCVPASATPATVFAASTLSWARELFSSQPVFRYFSVLRSW